MPAMTGLLSLLATGVLIALGFWLLGGVVLRVGGVLLVAVGLLSTAATGSPSAALDGASPTCRRSGGRLQLASVH